MENRSIGSLPVSLVGLGCNNFARKIDQEQSTDVVNAALDSGITHFDTADRYGYGDHPFRVRAIPRSSWRKPLAPGGRT